MKLISHLLVFLQYLALTALANDGEDAGNDDYVAGCRCWTRIKTSSGMKTVCATGKEELEGICATWYWCYIAIVIIFLVFGGILIADKILYKHVVTSPDEEE